MKKLPTVLMHLVAFIILTITSQVGGLIYLLAIGIKKILHLKNSLTVGIFIAAYLASTFFILPLVAPIFGRTALPLAGNLRPLNLATCFLNRHYVKPELKNQLVEISNQMSHKYEGTTTNYLDANFPFFKGFPLFPHLSHNDGKKLDLAFYYTENNQRSVSAPSFIGYGIFEEPKDGEKDYPTICDEKGYWQYGLLSWVVPQWNKDDFQVDEERTTTLIKLLAANQSTSKIFIEPHLKERWQLSNYDNIRFQGCQAVRHDDHIHTQIK